MWPGPRKAPSNSKHAGSPTSWTPSSDGAGGALGICQRMIIDCPHPAMALITSDCGAARGRVWGRSGSRQRRRRLLRTGGAPEDCGTKRAKGRCAKDGVGRKEAVRDLPPLRSARLGALRSLRRSSGAGVSLTGVSETQRPPSSRPA